MSRTDMLRLLDPGVWRPALFRGERLMAALRERAGEPRIEDLAVDFTAVAVDLMRQREVWLREGDLWDAVRASIAIPGLFTPTRCTAVNSSMAGCWRHCRSRRRDCRTRTG